MPSQNPPGSGPGPEAGAGPHRFPRKHRLLSAPDYGRALRGALHSQDALFRVKACLRPMEEQGQQLPFWRLGLAVSRRVDRRAVNRNRIKRVIRETFRQYPAPAGTLAQGQGIDLVVLALAGAASANNNELRSALARHFQRIAVRAQARKPAATERGPEQKR